MGEIIELDKSLLIPTQPELHPEKVERFLKSYSKNPMKVIIPVKNKELIIHGHHCSSILEALSEIKYIPLYGWDVKHEKDFMVDLPEEFFQNEEFIRENNNFIQKRYNLLEKDKFPSYFPKNLKEMREPIYWLKHPKIIQGYIPKKI